MNISVYTSLDTWEYMNENAVWESTLLMHEIVNNADKNVELPTLLVDLGVCFTWYKFSFGKFFKNWWISRDKQKNFWSFPLCNGNNIEEIGDFKEKLFRDRLIELFTKLTRLKSCRILKKYSLMIITKLNTLKKELEVNFNFYSQDLEFVYKSLNKGSTVVDYGCGKCFTNYLEKNFKLLFWFITFYTKKKYLARNQFSSDRNMMHLSLEFCNIARSFNSSKISKNIKDGGKLFS